MKLLKKVALVSALLCGGMANAAIVSGYGKAAAASDGWTVIYQGEYGGSFDYGSLLNGLGAGARVALASSSSSGALTFDLFAGTSLTTLQTVTGIDQTVFADDAYWYRNYYSVGFAPSATISQNSADIHNSGVWGATDAADGALRLSWHTNSNSDWVTGGWRSGLTPWLNSDQTWQRYVLVQDGTPENDVPEPASFALMGLGLAGLVAARRKAAK